MKNFNDSKIYLYFAIVTLALGILLGAISYYSVLIVEPKIDTLLSSTDNINTNYREAYWMLRDPQIFARYQYFDTASAPLINTIRNFNRKVETGDEFLSTDMSELEGLLQRRMKGSRLGRTTMIFFLILSSLGWTAFFFEKRQMGKA